MTLLGQIVKVQSEQNTLHFAYYLYIATKTEFKHHSFFKNRYKWNF